ncbi:hypothetical protein SDC9_122625 [bioreactor metagenome]|uniref:Uncharacterized protein n=1 Tax=bioreactor metagenome TaxID=1076179 RepID=A0A645CFD5_9ZZZZ
MFGWRVSVSLSTGALGMNTSRTIWIFTRLFAGTFTVSCVSVASVITRIVLPVGAAISMSYQTSFVVGSVDSVMVAVYIWLSGSMVAEGSSAFTSSELPLLKIVPIEANILPTSPSKFFFAIYMPNTAMSASSSAIKPQKRIVVPLPRFCGISSSYSSSYSSSSSSSYSSRSSFPRRASFAGRLAAFAGL